MFALVVMGKHCYQNLIEHMDHVIEEGSISQQDKELFLFTDDVNEAMEHIDKYGVKKFNLKERKAPKPFWLFNERK